MKLLIRAKAYRDIENIFRYIAKDNLMAARATRDWIFGAIEQLTTFPNLGRIGRALGTRERIVPRLPYVVVYRVLDTLVEVLAVFHTARNR